jgi:predicted regulator of amino acid metabolism with ACT domain
MVVENSQGAGIPVSNKASNNIETITLPSGAVAEVTEFKGRHVREAMKFVDGTDPYSIVFALIALNTKIDGKTIVMEDIDEMPGADALMLMGKFGGDNFRNV